MKYLIFALTLLLIPPCLAQFEDAPDRFTIDIGANGDSHSRSGSLKAVYPIKKINGYVGIYGMHAYADDTVQTEIIKSRFQGGYDFGRVSLEGFVETNRNVLKGLDRESHIGYFIRPMEIERENVRISGGLGNQFTNLDARNDLGLGATDILNVPKWLAFVSIDIHGFTTLLTYSPDINFSEHEFEISPSYNVVVSDDISIALNWTLDYDSEPVHDDIDKIHTAFAIVMRVHF